VISDVIWPHLAMITAAVIVAAVQLWPLTITQLLTLTLTLNPNPTDPNSNPALQQRNSVTRRRCSICYC